MSNITHPALQKLLTVFEKATALPEFESLVDRIISEGYFQYWIAPSPFDQFPTDPLQIILSFLPRKSLLDARLVCKVWATTGFKLIKPIYVIDFFSAFAKTHHYLLEKKSQFLSRKKEALSAFRSLEHSVSHRSYQYLKEHYKPGLDALNLMTWRHRTCDDYLKIEPVPFPDASNDIIALSLFNDMVTQQNEVVNACEEAFAAYLNMYVEFISKFKQYETLLIPDDEKPYTIDKRSLQNLQDIDPNFKSSNQWQLFFTELGQFPWRKLVIAMQSLAKYLCPVLKERNVFKSLQVLQIEIVGDVPTIDCPPFENVHTIVLDLQHRHFHYMQLFMQNHLFAPKCVNLQIIGENLSYFVLNSQWSLDSWASFLKDNPSIKTIRIIDVDVVQSAQSRTPLSGRIKPATYGDENRLFQKEIWKGKSRGYVISESFALFLDCNGITLEQNICEKFSKKRLLEEEEFEDILNYDDIKSVISCSDCSCDISDTE